MPAIQNLLAELKTDKGSIIIEGPVSAEQLSNLEMGRELNNFRPHHRQYEALISITRLPESQVFIARHDLKIVGYVNFLYPDRYTRWSRHPRVFELGGIEVALNWRNYKVGSALLRCSFMNERWENNIVITIEYFRHWDLKGNNLSMWEYRKQMDIFFGQVGFVVQPTSDPNIMEHPANVLMARFGKYVSPEDRLLFEQMASAFEM